jgi:hypothetical protein
VKITPTACEIPGCWDDHESNQTIVFYCRVMGERLQMPLRLCLRHSSAYERHVIRRVVAALDGRLCLVRDEHGGPHIFRPGDVS